MAKTPSSDSLLSEVSKCFTRHILIPPPRIQQFYGVPKVHKSKLHVSLQLVVSQYDSLIAAASTYIDYKLQLLTAKLRSYTANFQYIVNETYKLGELPYHAKLFTSNTENMYVNIHKEEGFPTVKRYLTTYGHTSLAPFDTTFIVTLLSRIISHSIFKFSDT